MPNNNPEKAKTSRIAARLIRHYLSPYFGLLVLAIFFMIVAAAMTAVAAGLMQPVLDDVLYGRKEDLILPVSFAVFLTFTVRGVSTYLHTIFVNRIGQNVVSDIQRALFNNFMTLDMAFFHNNPSGQLVSRVMSDVNVMRSVVSEGLTGLGKNLFTLIFLIALMVYQDWQLSLFVFCVFPVVSGSVILIGRKLRKVSRTIQSEMGILSSLLLQTFQGIRLIKAYGMEAHEKQKVGAAIVKVRDLNIKAVRLSNVAVPINEAIVGIIFGGLIIYGGYQVLNDAITPGGLAAFLAAFALTFEPMKRLAKLNNSLQMAFGAAERVFEMIDTQPEIIEKAQPQTLQVVRPEISFDAVQFAYARTEDAALKDVTFKAHAGEVTALVGSSGGGKTTIINLILRFYDPRSGSVRIDGNDIRDISLSSLRENIALVSQDVTIFDDTIIENIRFGDPKAKDEDVIAAAKAAAADDFIRALPQGYNTAVGENGVKLSGGQKQRLSIARAILRNAPILLLDEATSALDNEAEKSIQEALKLLQKDRTTIVIAHRLTTVQEADQILVLDRGCVIEQGRHDALLASDGVYARMYKSGLRE